MIKKDGNIIQVLDDDRVVVQVLETKKIIVVSDACGRELVYRKTVCPAVVWDNITAIKKRGVKKDIAKTRDVKEALYRFTQTLYSDKGYLKNLSEKSVEERINEWTKANLWNVYISHLVPLTEV